MLAFTILSLVLLAAFTVWASSIQGGIPQSYSQLGTDVGDYFPGAAVNPWSIVTFAVAFLMLPPMIEAGTDSPWQCLGFFAPLYLIVVALTPDWATDRRQLWVHRAGAAVCAIAALLWLVTIRGDLGRTLVVYVAVAVAGAATRSIRESWVFWLEAGLFLSVYGSLMIGG